MSHSEPLNLRDRVRERERAWLLQWAERKVMDGRYRVRFRQEKGRTKKERKWDGKIGSVLSNMFGFISPSAF